MLTNGKYYSAIAGKTSEGNDKYSTELRECIEEAGNLCEENLNSDSYSPIMLLGSIQSGKTRAFIGLMALCFDNGFDMTLILTKCSKALVQQTVKRMTSEFDCFRSGNATVGDVVAQDILDIDFTGCRDYEEKEEAVSKFLKRYRGKKRIIVVKKQADNVDRMNMFIAKLVKQNNYKRILVVDDEADITSVGYEKNRELQELSLRRISGAINTARKKMHSSIEHVMMQVTATPYALYLQPQTFSNDDIMPVKPARTVVMPTGKGYIGGKYYFIDSIDQNEDNYDLAKHLPHIVDQDEMNIINGSDKNKSKNSKIKDGRTMKKGPFITGQSKKSTYALPSVRSWLFDIITGSAIIQLNPGYEDFYVSAVMHAATTKALHKKEVEIINEAVESIKDALENDINDKDVAYFVKQSYDDLKASVRDYKLLTLPDFDEVYSKIADLDEDGELEGLITEIDVKEVNSDSDIMKLLNDAGELRLENSITIFVGGQVLDRGITIPNMINFFYGRDPKTMQQDTVVQHCRMFGYRSQELLSVTRFYTTRRLFNNMHEITVRDTILRERIRNQSEGLVIYLESGKDIKACSPSKILASEINNVLPEKRYLPIGFDIVNDKKKAKQIHDDIRNILEKNSAILSNTNSQYRKGQEVDGKFVMLSPDIVQELLKKSYDALEAKDDGICNTFSMIEPTFLFSISGMNNTGFSDVAVIVRENRKLGKYKKNGTMYQDGPDDGNNEGALAKKLRETMPVLVLTEQTSKEWKYPFWWPVYYTPKTMNVGIYAEKKAKDGIIEDIRSADQKAIFIEKFELIDTAGIDSDVFEKLLGGIEDVENYYNKAFYIKHNPGKRTGIICPIKIEDYDTTSKEEVVKKKLDRIKKQVIAQLNQAGIDENSHPKTDLLLSQLSDLDITDELVESAQDEIEALEMPKPQKMSLILYIQEATTIISGRREIGGLFIPLGSGRCEIRLYLETIREWSGNDEGLTLKLCKYVMAHEMYHAYHYAEVMTESGRWIYTRKDSLKQSALQETLAEYFGLCFSKYCIDDSDSKVETFIKTNRYTEEFPQDGGYSGALILEKCESSVENVGKDNLVYHTLFTTSLSDMPKAYRQIPLEQ